MTPVILKTKYAFHSLMWLLKPDLVLDVGSMDGSDSVRFRSLLKQADLLAFEANPDNFELMCKNDQIGQYNIQVENNLVSKSDGTKSFFIQRPQNPSVAPSNKGTSSALPRNDDGMQNIEVRVDSVRLDTFLNSRFPNSSGVALWIDVEGFAFDVLESIEGAANRICLIHVEVETRECWPGQHLEPEVVQLLTGLGFHLLAQGNHAIQRDLIFVRSDLYMNGGKSAIDRMLRLARLAGPALSKLLALFPH